MTSYLNLIRIFLTGTLGLAFLPSVSAVIQSSDENTTTMQISSLSAVVVAIHATSSVTKPDHGSLYECGPGTVKTEAIAEFPFTYDDCGVFAISAISVVPKSTGQKLLTTGNRVPNAGGVIKSFKTQQDEVFFRVFSGDNTTGSFLTKVPPKSSAFAQEALALQPGNTATFIQRVTVPAGTNIQRSRALPAFGRRGGAEQFELLEHIPNSSFGSGVPLP